MSLDPIHVIGGGLAGSEAAWQIAEAGVPVVLHEMRPVRGTDAHQTDRPGRAGLLQLLPLRRLGPATPSACCTPRCARWAR